MTAIVHFVCRNPDHMRGARGGGALVIHHGSVGYCEGVNVDGAHRWISTGGVPIEYLRDSSAVERRVASGATHEALSQARPSAGGNVDFAREPRVTVVDLRSGAPRPDDPEREPKAGVRMTVLSTD